MKYSLWIIPKTYSIEVEIINGLKNRNSRFKTILEYSDNPLLSFLSKIYFFHKLRSIFFSIKIFLTLRNNDFSKVFIVRGEFINNWLLSYISRNKLIKTTIYQWDSLNNYDYSRYFNYGFRIFTFSKFDSNKHNLEYLPLFSTSNDKILNSHFTRIYDFVHIGTYSKFREEILSELNIKPNLKLFFHLYLPPLGYIKYLIFKFKFPKFTYPYKFGKIKTLHLYRKSKVVFDIMTLNDKLLNESGVSINVFRALSVGASVISNNSGINYLNFHKDMLFKLSFDDQKLNNFDFSQLSNNENFEFNYTVENWLDEIL